VSNGSLDTNFSFICGIDLISKYENQYYAIQCKYRKPQGKTQVISWKSLSTFYAMVAKSGPWKKHITMTNVNGCRHIGEKTEKDWSICIGTFRNINHFDWLKICGASPTVTTSTVVDTRLDKDTLRNARLAYFT
jgi:predicted helicase